MRGLPLSDWRVLTLLKLSFIGHSILKYIITIYANLRTNLYPPSPASSCPPKMEVTRLMPTTLSDIILVQMETLLFPTGFSGDNAGNEWRLKGYWKRKGSPHLFQRPTQAQARKRKFRVDFFLSLFLASFIHIEPYACKILKPSSSPYYVVGEHVTIPDTHTHAHVGSQVWVILALQLVLPDQMRCLMAARVTGAHQLSVSVHRWATMLTASLHSES